MYHFHPGRFPGDLQVATFLTNHDQNRVMEELSLDVPRAKAAAALYLTLPGVPFVYYGEEVGMLGQKPDPDIRRPMQWSAEAHAGFSTRTPWHPPNANYRAWNVAEQDADAESLLSHYRRLIQARNEREALRRGEYHAVTATSDAVMAFLRWHEGDAVLVLVNTSDEPQADVALGLPPGLLDGPWAVFDLAAAEDPGGAIVINADGRAGGIALDAHQARVLSFLAPIDTEAEDTPQTFGLDAPYPNPAAGLARFTYRLDAITSVGGPSQGATTQGGNEPVRIEVFDVLGRRLQTVLDRQVAAGAHSAAIDTRDLAAGTYVVRLRHGARQATQRFVVAR